MASAFPVRRRPLLAVAVFSLIGLAMGVMARDLTKQLELIEAHRGRGLVLWGEIGASRSATLPDDPELPWTLLTVKPLRTIVGEAGEQVEVFVPGDGDRRLSISPEESAIRVGEKVLLFLRADANVRAVDADAWRLDSFAEIFRTQTNRRQEVVVLGRGYGSAVAENARLVDLEPAIRSTVDALRAASKPEGK